MGELYSKRDCTCVMYNVFKVVKEKGPLVDLKDKSKSLICLGTYMLNCWPGWRSCIKMTLRSQTSLMVFKAWWWMVWLKFGQLLGDLTKDITKHLSLFSFIALLAHQVKGAHTRGQGEAAPPLTFEEVKKPKCNLKAIFRSIMNYSGHCTDDE